MTTAQPRRTNRPPWPAGPLPAWPSNRAGSGPGAIAFIEKRSSLLAGILQAPAPVVAGKEGCRCGPSRRWTVGGAQMHTFGDEQGPADFGRDTSRGIRPGRGTRLRPRLRVPAPEREQGIPVDFDDAFQAAGVVCPAGGEQQGS